VRAAGRPAILIGRSGQAEERGWEPSITGGFGVIASAGGYAATETALAAFTPARPNLRVVDVAPLSSSDPRALTLFYLVVALIFGGYIAATFITKLVGQRSQYGLRATIR
jgi:hypothetical protein